MALLNGIFNDTFNPAQLNTRSMREAILRIYPGGNAPIYAMSSQSGKATAKASTHGYFSKTLTFLRQTLTAGYLVGAGTVSMPATAGMHADMVLHNLRTRENLLIVSVDSATQVTVSRAFGRIVAAAGNIGDILLVVGTAHMENSNRPTARNITTVYVPNYTQIFRNAWGATDTARASMTEAGFGNVQESRKDCMLLHAVDIEGALIHGQAKMDTSGSQPRHSTQGILDSLLQYAPGNVAIPGATTNYDQLVAMIDPAFAYSTDMASTSERVAFCDDISLRVLNKIGRASGQYQIMSTTTTFGLRYSQFNTQLGTVNLIRHPGLNGMASTYGRMVVMDMPGLKLAYMSGRDGKVEEYGENGKPTNGVDGVGGSLTSELAVELVNPQGCVFIDGLQAGA